MCLLHHEKSIRNTRFLLLFIFRVTLNSDGICALNQSNFPFNIFFRSRIKVCSNHSKKEKIYSVQIIVPVISILITSTNLLQFDSMLPRIKEQKNQSSLQMFPRNIFSRFEPPAFDTQGLIPATATLRKKDIASSAKITEQKVKRCFDDVGGK